MLRDASAGMGGYEMQTASQQQPQHHNAAVTAADRDVVDSLGDWEVED